MPSIGKSLSSIPSFRNRKKEKRRIKIIKEKKRGHGDGLAVGRASVAKPADLRLIPRSQGTGENQLPQLSSDFHTCCVAHSCPPQ